MPSSDAATPPAHSPQRIIPSDGPPKSPTILIVPPWLIILIAALTVRVYAAANLGCLSRDGVQFVTYAKRLAVEPVDVLRDTTKQPGYSALMLAVNRITINPFYQDHPIIWQACGQFVAVAGGIACCLLIYLLARRLFGDGRIALIAGLMAAAWPQGVLLSGDVLSDMPHLALYLGALLIGIRAIDHGALWRFAVCGAVAGLGYLIRQEALGLVAAIAVCAFIPLHQPQLAKRLFGVVLMIASFAFVVAPYPIATGRLMPNKSLDELLFGRDEPTASRASPEFDPDATRAFPRVVQARGAQFLAPAHVIPWYEAPARMAEEWCKSGRYVLSTLVLIALFLKSVPRAESRAARLVILAIILQLLAVQLRVKSYGEISSRYLVIPAALTTPWAAAALATLVPLIAGRLARAANDDSLHLARQRLRSLWLSASLLVFVPLVFYATKPINADKAPYKLAGWWLRSNTQRTDRIFAHDRLEQLMFYAGRIWPETTWVHGDDGRSEPSMDRLTAIVNEAKPDYFVEARRSRDGDRAPQDAFFDRLTSEALPSFKVIWETGPAEHEVHILRAVKETNRQPPKVEQ